MDWVDLQGTLSMKFGNDDVTSVGQKLSQEQVQPMPTFTIAQTSAAGSANTFEGKNFTVAFLDANYPGAPLGECPTFRDWEDVCVDGKGGRSLCSTSKRKLWLCDAGMT